MGWGSPTAAEQLSLPGIPQPLSGIEICVAPQMALNCSGACFVGAYVQKYSHRLEVPAIQRLAHVGQHLLGIGPHHLQHLAAQLVRPGGSRHHGSALVTGFVYPW